MRSVKVKICGITNLRDALAAAANGADAVGFVFFQKSPRYVTPAAAAEIIRQLPPLVSAVGVFVDPSLEYLRKVLAVCPLDHIQLHGDEPPVFCRKIEKKLHARVIKGFRISSRENLKPVARYDTTGILLDTRVPGQAGGTGRTFDWDIVRNAGLDRRRLILAGGLSVRNAARAIRAVRPWCVDVSSGVERRPGVKDMKKMKQFISIAKRTRIT
jgi:phosphoribosylanthranilate isomerase